MAIAISLPDLQVLQHWLVKIQFTTKRRTGFYRDMANAVRAGMGPFKAAERMRDVSRPRKSLRWLVDVLDPVLQSAAEGASFARALSEWVPAEDAAMLSAGEESDNMAGALDELVGLLQAKGKVTSSLKTNLVPSVFMMAFVIGILSYVMRVIVPLTKDMLEPADMLMLDVLPVYVAVGDFVINKGIWLILFIVAVTLCIAVSLPRWAPDKVRTFLDQKTPPWSLYARIQTVFFLITASSIMRAGRTFRVATEKITILSTPWMRGYLGQMLARLRNGQDEISSMQVNMLPIDVADKLNFYAILPEFTQIMKEVARDAMEHLLVTVQRVGALVRTLVMALAVVFVISTMYSMFEMTQAIESKSQLSGFQR